MNNAALTETVNAVHKFEAAGLGAAPYKFIGSAELKFQAVPGDPNCPIQPGGSCDYCSTGIYRAFYFRSADGKEFKVGCDCFVKANSDKSLAAKVNADIRKREGVKREAKKQAVKADVTAILADDGNRAELASMPHPKGFDGLSALDYADWMLARCGAAGRMRLLKSIQEMLGT